MTARGLAYRDPQVHVAGIGMRGGFRLNRDGVSLPHLTATALGGTFEGRVEVRDNFEKLEVDGSARDLDLAKLTEVNALPQPVAWSGIASGPVSVAGRIAPGAPHDFTVRTTLSIARAPGAIPIEGNLDMVYDQRASTLQFGNSALSTPDTRMDFSGTLGESMRGRLETKNLTDLLPGLAMVSSEAPKELPLTLAGGAATEPNPNVLAIRKFTEK